MCDNFNLNLYLLTTCQNVLVEIPVKQNLNEREEEVYLHLLFVDEILNQDNQVLLSVLQMEETVARVLMETKSKLSLVSDFLAFESVATAFSNAFFHSNRPFSSLNLGLKSPHLNDAMNYVHTPEPVARERPTTRGMTTFWLVGKFKRLFRSEESIFAFSHFKNLNSKSPRKRYDEM